MKAKSLATLMIAGIAAGCAAAPAHNDEAAVESSAQALTLQECGTQRDDCLNQVPLLGLLLCPLQYTQCVATASNGIPAQVTSAIQDTAACAQANATCLRSANSAATALSCAQTEGQCLAGVLNAHLPPIVTGTEMCLNDAVDCVRGAETAADLANCTSELEGCAVDNAVASLPPEVGTAITSIDACTATLGACTDAAKSPGDLAACSQNEVSCVANALGVTPPQPVQAAVHCAETAADCVLDATSIAAVRACASDLVMCNAQVAAPILTCDQKWTQCLARNPLAFIQCSIDLLTCQNTPATN